VILLMKSRLVRRSTTFQGLEAHNRPVLRMQPEDSQKIKIHNLPNSVRMFPMPSQADFLAAKKSMSSRFLRKASPAAFSTFALAASTKPVQNVVGVGVGTKFSAGKETETQCVRFYVEHKIHKNALSSKNQLPSEVDGLPTDVIATGKFVKLSTASDNKKRRRPVRPGTSIGFKIPPPKDNFVMAGTFGAVVSKGGKNFILSNNHVLAENGVVALGAAIFQPGLLDGGNEATDQVASLTKFIEIKPTGFNKVDCAMAEFLAATTVSPILMPRVGALASANPVTATAGMLVEKTGRTTGYTKGKVFDIASDVNVDYEDKDGNTFTATFADQMLIVGAPGMFSDRGDSGSLIVEQSSKQATGLLFAGSSSHTIANHIADVLAALGVTLVVA
jgi:hypothetical protein